MESYVQKKVIVTALLLISGVSLIMFFGNAVVRKLNYSGIQLNSRSLSMSHNGASTTAEESNEVEKSHDLFGVTNEYRSSGSPEYMLKDVGEPFMDNFGLSEEDFELMKQSGVKLLGVSFDICAGDKEVQTFLDRAKKYDMKVILPAGAGEAEWGYTCDTEASATQKPHWNRQDVVQWVHKWKAHPALYGWDTSNEAGGNFPNAEKGVAYFLSLDQLQQAYADVKKTDPNHPILIRMNGWFFYDNDDNFFRAGNPFGKGVADIVIVNAYSNVEDYYDDFVGTVTNRAMTSIRDIAPNTSFIIALGGWEELPLWRKPSIEHFDHDFNEARKRDPVAIAVFKFGAKGSEWWMPKSNPELWKWLSTAF